MKYPPLSIQLFSTFARRTFKTELFDNIGPSPSRASFRLRHMALGLVYNRVLID